MLLRLLYALYPALVCTKSAHMFQRLSCLCILFCSCLFKVCSHVSETPMLALCTLSCSCLYKVCSHVSETLMLPLRTLSCSFLFQMFSHSLYAIYRSLSAIMSLPQTLRLFYVSLLAISPYQQYTALSFSKGRHDRIHKLTSSRAILCYTPDISFSDAYFPPLSSN